MAHMAARSERLCATAFSVSILRQSRRPYGCWPLKGASSQPLKSKSKNKSKSLSRQTSLVPHRQSPKKQIPGNVKLLLPPRQSRGASHVLLVKLAVPLKFPPQFVCELANRFPIALLRRLFTPMKYPCGRRYVQRNHLGCFKQVRCVFGRVQYLVRSSGGGRRMCFGSSFRAASIALIAFTAAPSRFGKGFMIVFRSRFR